LVTFTIDLDIDIRTRARFFYSAPVKFHRPTFNRSAVIMLTNKLINKQTPLKTSTWKTLLLKWRC